MTAPAPKALRVAVLVRLPLDGSPVELLAPEGYGICAGWEPSSIASLHHRGISVLTAQDPALCVIWERQTS